ERYVAAFDSDPAAEALDVWDHGRYGQGYGLIPADFAPDKRHAAGGAVNAATDAQAKAGKTHHDPVGADRSVLEREVAFAIDARAISGGIRLDRVAGDHAVSQRQAALVVDAAARPVK